MGKKGNPIKKVFSSVKRVATNNPVSRFIRKIAEKKLW